MLQLAAEVRRRTAYERIAVFGDGRLDDERLNWVYGPDHLVSLAGPAGSVAFTVTGTLLAIELITSQRMTIIGWLSVLLVLESAVMFFPARKLKHIVGGRPEEVGSVRV